nr:MAG TPA: hypothetical protein [Caudoviricetes sp.]
MTTRKNQTERMHEVVSVNYFIRNKYVRVLTFEYIFNDTRYYYCHKSPLSANLVHSIIKISYSLEKV